MTSAAVPALPAPPPGFDPEAEFDNVTPETFTAVPKSSHRREGGDRELRSLLALGVLTLYLSNKKGWRPPNAEKLAAKYKEGATLIRDAVKELERAGFVVRYRTQGPGGLWKTHVRVSADPTTLDAVRVWAVELTAAQDAQAAARKAAGLSGGGRRAVAARAAADAPDSTDQGGEPLTSGESAFPQVGPDVTDGDSVHRDSVDRDSVQGDLKNQETVVGDQEEIPPCSNSDSHDARTTGATAGGISDLDPKHRAALNAAVTTALKERPGKKGWAKKQVVAAVKDALDAGHPADVVALTLSRFARDTNGTDYPTRLRPYLDAEARRAAAAAPAPAEPYRHKHLPRDVRRCSVHRDQPAETCALEGHPNPNVTREEAAKALAAVKAKLKPGVPLSRRGTGRGAPVSTNPGTATSGDVAAATAPESVNA